MKKFRKVFALSLSMVLLLTQLFLPAELYKAEIIGFTAPIFRSYYYNQGQKFTGNSVYNGSSTWNFYSYPGRMDNTNMNMAFEFAFGLSGPTIPENANLYGKSYSLSFVFGCKSYNQGKLFVLNTNEIQSFSCIVTYADGAVDELRCDYIISSSTDSASGNYIVSLNISGFLDRLVQSISFSIYFNYHYAFSVPVDYASNNSMDMYVSPINSWSNTTPTTPPVSDIPEVVLPDVDADGVPDLDDFTAGDSDVGATVGIFTSYGPVLTMMIIVAAVGLVSYVLFGKR